MTRRLLFLAAIVSTAEGQQIYDLLLKNGNVIDPANRRGGRMDVAVAGNKIARVGRDLPAAQARLVIDAGQYYVTPGLIDINAHFDADGVIPDHNTLTSGVTTAVDAGSSGSRNFESFKTVVIDRARTQLLAFLNIADLDSAAAAQIVRKYPRLIVGVRAAGPEAVARAVKAAELSNTVAMVELSGKSGSEYSDLLKILRVGDIQTHVYARSIPQLDGDQKIQPWVWEARKRGVLFDVGHGSDGLWFRIAVPAIRQGFLPDTISTGMDKNSIMLPRTNMITTLSKFLNMGLTVEQLIERTTVNPARAIRRTDLGTLTEGAIADIALLEVQEGSFGFLDSGHARLTGDRRLRCVLTVRNGAVVWDTEGLSTPDSAVAGPYSNFK